ncbi:anticodon-binding protein, partial [Amylostereum chailletii]
SDSQQHTADIATDPFASYFETDDPTIAPKVLITTPPKATCVSYELCEEVVRISPGAELIRRPKGRGFEMGRIAGWAAGRGSACFSRSRVWVLFDIRHRMPPLSCVFPTARATPHNPELVLNNFVTRLGHSVGRSVGRMFQTFLPPLPEFQGRQVVTLHNQHDFLFFRRHRYAFRSDEKVSLQKIGPRFTLKLRSLKKGIPAVRNPGEAPKPLEFDDFGDEVEEKMGEDPVPAEAEQDEGPKDDDSTETGTTTVPPKSDEYEWIWKPELETTRRTFFL